MDGLGGERQEWGWSTDKATWAEEAWQCVRMRACACASAGGAGATACLGALLESKASFPSTAVITEQQSVSCDTVS